VRRSIPDYPQIVLVALIVVVSGALIFAASTSTVAFGTYNPSWDGASDLRSEADAVDVESEIVYNTSSYTSTPANDTLALILSPESSYSSSDTERIASFVRNGGTVLIAEDTGNYSNDVLAAIGADIRFDKRMLRDERNNYRSPAMPVASNVSDHPLTTDVDRLTFNYGTAVRPNNSTVLVSSSGYAYLDTNRNSELDDDESLGTYPVAAVESVGDGRVIAVSDPSIFINTMLDRSGNQAFVRTVFQQHDQLLLDYSHAGSLPVLSVALLVLRDTPLFQFFLGALGVAVLGIGVRRPELFTQLTERWTTQGHTSPGAEPEELAAVIRKRHPDWDDERTERVIQAIMNQRENSSRND